MGTVAEAAAAQLRADLELLNASTKEAATLLDAASFQLGELVRQTAPMTSKTQALARAADNISAAKQRSEEVLEHLDASRKMQGVIQAGPRAHLDGFLAALDRLEAAIAFLQAHRSMAAAEDALAHTVALRDSALSACSREFSALLQKHASMPPALLARLRSTAVAEASSGGVGGHGAAAVPDLTAVPGAALGLLPEAVLSKLKALAGPMLRGSGRTAVKAYAESRRGAVQGVLEAFLAPFANKEELARLSWQQMEGRIPGWVAALHLYVRLAQEEARLCAAVFPPAEQAAVLSQVAGGGAASLLEAADQVLAARRVPEKLFGVLDMHDAAERCLPPLRAALAAGSSRLDRALGAGDASSLPVVGQLSQLRVRLGAEVRACFAELQESVARDAAKGVPSDGTVHPLCATAVSLLRRVLVYQSALAVLFGDGGNSSAVQGGAASLAVEARLLERMAAATAQLFDSLLAALDAKAKLTYKNQALSALHRMNNVAHVVHACEASRELKAVGEGWAEQHKPKVEECQQLYVEQAWGGLLSLLQQDGRQGMPSGLSGDKGARQGVKDKWQAVNKMLAEAQGQQSWAVPDAALRFSVKDALSDRLLPLYEAFWNKYRQAPYTDHHSKYERYSPADVANIVNELFEKAEAGAPGMLLRSNSRSPANNNSGGGSGGGTLSRKLSGSFRRLTSSQGTP